MCTWEPGTIMMNMDVSNAVIHFYLEGTEILMPANVHFKRRYATSAIYLDTVFTRWHFAPVLWSMLAFADTPS